MFTQETYNLIVKILQNGAPALANDLIASLNYLIAENQRLAEEKETKVNEVKEEK